jgi:hypothetical protein
MAIGVGRKAPREIAMRRRFFVLAALLLAAGVGAAQEPPEVGRTWCRDQDPRNKCPGPDCVCTDDTLEVTFDGGSDSVLEIADFRPGEKVTTSLVMEARSEGIQGWSYGVRHDQGLLTLLSATNFIESPECFICVFDPRSVEDCTEDPNPRCPDPRPGGGYVFAVVLSLTSDVRLPPGRHTVALAEYTLDADPGEQGTLIQVTDRLKVKNSPPASIIITVDGRNRAPRRLVDGWVKRPGLAPGVPFHRGDADGDGAAGVSDAIRVLLFLHAGGPAPGCLEAADFDDGASIDTTDAVAVLEWLFRGGSGPPPPGPPRLPCNFDPPGSPALGCASYPGC